MIASQDPGQAITATLGRDTFVIASQVAFFRRQLGWTQAELAQRLGMPQAAIGRLEQTPDDQWTLRTLGRVCGALDVRASVTLPTKEEQPHD
jgi:transcriptional regulator with XRE-family HTH domain